MSDLTGSTISTTYNLLLTTESAVMGSSLQSIESGTGVPSALQLSSTVVGVNGTGGLQVDNGSEANTTVELDSTGRYKYVEFHHSGARKGYVGYDSTDNVMRLYASPASSTIEFGTVDTPQMYIDATGNVGIGGTPDANLHVFGPNPKLRLQDSDEVTSTVYTDIFNDSGNTYFRSKDGISNGIFTFNGYNGTTHTEYMRIDSSGNVGIGGEAKTKLDVIVSAVTGYSSVQNDGIVIERGGATAALNIATDNDQQGAIWFADGDAANSGQIIYDHDDDSLQLGTAATEAMRIDSLGRTLCGGITGASGFGDLETTTFTTEGQCILARTTGSVGIGTDMAAATDPVGKLVVSTGDLVLESGVTVNGNADELVIQNDAAAGISILTPNSNSGWLIFGDTDSSNEGMIAYDHGGSLTGSPGADSMLFYTDGSSRMTIDSSGDVKIGDSATDVDSKLVVSGNGSVATAAFMYDGDAGTYLAIETGAADAAVNLKADARSGAFPPLTFETGGTESMRIDSSGNVTFSSAATLSSGSSAGALKIFGGATNQGGQIDFHGGTSSDGILVFRTGAASGEQGEAMRIDSSGDVSIASGKLMLGAATPSAVDGYLYLSGDSDQYIKGDAGSNWMALFTASTERMRIDSDGRVHVRMYNQYMQNDGTTAAGQIGNANKVNGNTESDLALYAAGGIEFSTGGSSIPKVSIDSSGNVGIATADIDGPLDIGFNADAGTDPYRGGFYFKNSHDTANPNRRVKFDQTSATAFAIQTVNTDETTASDGTIVLQPNGGDVGIGTDSPNANAVLDVASTTKAFMPPRMTTTQRDAISSPTAGMVIYNSTTNVLDFHNGTTWGAV